MKPAIYKSTSRHGRVTWRYEIVTGRDAETGARIREGESGFELKREAEDAADKKIEELNGGYVTTVGTLGEFLKTWLPYHIDAKKLAPKTAERYASLAAHATRALGHVPLKDLTPFMFDDLYVKLAKKLAPKTVREVHNVIHVAMKRAVKTKLVPYNPSDNCDLPRVDEREAHALSAKQLTGYQEAATGSWVDLMIRFAAAIGVRRGELLALRWADLDWGASQIRVARSVYQIKGQLGVKPTKQRTTRYVTVPQSVVAYLRIHREQQEQVAALVGGDYRRDLDLIFADPTGNYLLPSTVTRAAKRVARKAGFDDLQPLHGMRHTHASAMLQSGVPITDVARRLGHRDTHTTARIYAHSLPDADKNTAAKWDEFIAQPKLVPQPATTSDADEGLKN